jgi:hypothetical protein
MDIYQRGLLTLQRLRQGGQQTVTVVHHLVQVMARRRWLPARSRSESAPCAAGNPCAVGRRQWVIETPCLNQY